MVDEAATARIRLRRLLEGLGHQVVGEASDWEQALLRIRELNPQLVLLDLTLPGHGGLWIAEKLREMAVDARVIFVTTAGEFAQEALQREGLDYLLKPVQPQSLQQLLARREDGESADPSVHTRGRGQSRRRLALREIWFFQAEQGQVLAYDGLEKHPVAPSLKQLETDYGERFIRIHRSYLVDCHRIERLEHDGQGGARLWLKGYGQPLPVSSRLLARVRSSMSC